MRSEEAHFAPFKMKNETAFCKNKPSSLWILAAEIPLLSWTHLATSHSDNKCRLAAQHFSSIDGAEQGSGK